MGSGVARARVPGRAPLITAGTATLALYAPVLAGMAAEWARFPSQSHGFAVPVISAYLIWMRRGAATSGLPDSSLATTSVGLAALVTGLGALLIGSLAGETFLARISMPLALLGVVLFVGGAAALRRVWVGLAYLLFMVPVPYLTVKMLTYPSRLLDAGITAAALRRLGVPVLQDGVMLHLANVTLEVADDCSSVPAIAALIALGVAYALLRPRPVWTRITLALAAAPLGLLANIARLILTALAAYLVGPVVLGSVLHQFAGTTVFLATILLLGALDRMLTRLAGPRG
jgi:exosortase